MRILVAYPEDLLITDFPILLTEEKWSLYHVNSGEEGLSLALHYQDYDALILGLILPDMSGFEVLEKLRRHNSTTLPVLALSPFGRVEEKIKALNCGADDVLDEPFHKRELEARLYAIIRRVNGYANSVLRVGRLSLDIENKIFCVDEKTLHLTDKEQLAIECLFLKAGRVVTKETLFLHLYDGCGYCDQPDLQIVDVYICKIRAKVSRIIGKDECKRHIQSSWGRGYCLARLGEETNNQDQGELFVRCPDGVERVGPFPFAKRNV